MEKGYNSDIFVRGEKYHIQTEDWGQRNPFVVTRVYKNGAVVKTQKTSYQDIFGNYARLAQLTSEVMKQMGEAELRSILQKAIQKQHHQLMESL